MTEDEKWRLLGEADLLCAPSLGGESFGIILVEAMSAGAPVVRMMGAPRPFTNRWRLESAWLATRMRPPSGCSAAA